jgi:hypothetical protein
MRSAGEHLNEILVDMDKLEAPNRPKQPRYISRMLIQDVSSDEDDEEA